MKQKFIRWTIQHPWQSIVLAIGLSLFIASGVRFIHIEDDIMKMLPDDLPSRLVWDEIEEQFGSTEPLLISIGKEGQSIFNKEMLARVWDLTRALEAQPTVDEVRSLAAMDKLASDDGFLDVSDLMPARDLTDDEIRELKDYLDRNPDFARMLVAPDESYTMLMAVPAVGVSDEEFLQTLEMVQGTSTGDDSFYVAGLPYIRGSLTKIVRTEIVKLMRIGLFILALILLINLRSLPGLFMILAVIVLSAASMVGFFGWVYHLTGSATFNFTLINSNMPIILLTIATADGVHIMTRFFREMRERKDVKASVAATMDVMYLPVFLTSVTTMAGFLSLTTAPLKAMTGYGIALSFGIAWAWYLSVTLLPSLMSLKKWPSGARALLTPGVFERIIHRVGQYVLLKPKVVLAAGTMVVLVSLIGITFVKVEVNVVNFFRSTSPIRQSMEFIDDHYYGTLNFAFKIDGDLKEPEVLRYVESIQDRLEQEPTIGNTLSIANIIAKLHRVVMDDSLEYEIIPDTRAKVANLLTLYSMAGDPDDFSSLIDYNYQSGLLTATVKMSSTEELVHMVNRLERDITALPRHNTKIQLSGFPIFLRDFMDVLITSSLRSLALSVLLVCILSWIFFKSLRWGLLAIIPLCVAIILNFGLMGWFGIELSHVTALFTSIIIGVGVDFAVHFIAQYKNFLRKGIRPEEVSQMTIDDVGYPILLNVVAVSVGFSALLFSEFIPMTYMGGLVIISMVSCAIGTLTILATLTHLMRRKVTA